MQNAKKMTKAVNLENQNFEKLAQGTRNLMDNVLLVRKTPKFERLKDSTFIKHNYI